MDENQQPHEVSPMLPPQSGPLSTAHVSPRSNPYPFDSKYKNPPQTYLHPRTPGSYSSILSSPQSPWAGLDEKQIKKLIKLNKTQNEYVEYQQKLTAETAAFTLSQQRPPSKAELLSMMGQTLDTLPEHRTFSSLTTDDFEKLRAGGERGQIFINEKTISNEMRDFKISDDFWSGLQATRQVMSRVKEMGVRHVIGHFLIHATLIARQMFKEERLIVHPEYEVEETAIPPIGKLQGPLDFLTSRAAGYLPMEMLMDENDGSMVMVAKPLFVCVEAKRQDTHPCSSSKAQLLAQIKALQAQRSITSETCLMSNDMVSRTGAISDGLRWGFWHIHNDGWYFYQQDTRDRYAAEKTLAILVYLVAGKFPSTDPSSALFIKPIDIV